MVGMNKLTDMSVWIKTSDKLPETGQKVLGWDNYWEEIHIYIYANFVNVTWCIAEGVDYKRLEKYESDWYPVYWMPLPDSP